MQSQIYVEAGGRGKSRVPTKVPLHQGTATFKTALSFQNLILHFKHRMNPKMSHHIVKCLLFLKYLVTSYAIIQCCFLLKLRKVKEVMVAVMEKLVVICTL